MHHLRINLTMVVVGLQERWLQPGAEYLQEEGCYYKRFMPFGEGLRSCLGQNLAVIAMRTILAHLLGRYTFKLSGQVTDPYYTHKAVCITHFPAAQYFCLP
jgi:cytochrome P450